MIHTEAYFSNVRDMRSQLGFIILMMDDHGAVKIIHYASERCKRVTLLVMDSELHAPRIWYRMDLKDSFVNPVLPIEPRIVVLGALGMVSCWIRLEAGVCRSSRDINHVCVYGSCHLVLKFGMRFFGCSGKFFHRLCPTLKSSTCLFGYLLKTTRVISHCL